MNKLFRLLRVWLRSHFAAPAEFGDVGRLPMRVWPSDLDPLLHMNNGVYLSLLDLGRIDLMSRAGVWRRLKRLGVYPVVASQTISYRKSLDLWQRFELETRLAGYDTKAVYVEQRFVVDGEVFARAIVRARFLRRGGGVVPIDELVQQVAPDAERRELPEWVERWAHDVALPSTRQPAPSLWE